MDDVDLDWNMVSANLFNRVNIDYNFICNPFARDALAEPEFTTFIHRTKVNTNFTRAFSLRVIEELNSFDERLERSARLRGQLRNGRFPGI